MLAASRVVLGSACSKQIHEIARGFAIVCLFECHIEVRRTAE
jgi:hypothetical protein